MNFKKLKKIVASTMIFTTFLTNSMVYAATKTTTDNENISTTTISSDSSDENVLKVDVNDKGELNYTVPVSSTGLEEKLFSWDNALVYFVITDRFVNGDKSNDHSYGRSTTEVDADKYETRQGTFHGGDLKGLTSKLNEGYFTDLGINAIWITAPYEQIHGAVSGQGFKHYAYHGYYALDFSNMDANMGTEKDLETFIDTAHTKGIRVIFDVVMNHAGYPDPYTANEYGFGKLSSNWKDMYYNTPESKYTWDMDYTGGTDSAGSTPGMMEYSGDWKTNYWGTDWIRLVGARFSGYDGQEGNSLTALTGGLPDFKTENTNPVGLPKLLENKWKKEGRYEKEMAELNAYFAKGHSKTVTQYMVKWLTDWVREYGVDGFRCDTAKHVEQGVWKQLKDEAKVALKEWRTNNPTKPGAQWTDDFWMTGEHYDWSMNNVAGDSYFQNGFDSMINFDYQGSAFTSGASLISLHQRYADKINSTENNVLSYISSHDKGLSRGNMIAAGTSLVLAPGGVQIYYGDETARKASVSGEQGWRSQMNFGSEDKAVLAHWQKVGNFRNNHLAVGAGKQVTLNATTCSRIYEKGGVSDKVVISLPGKAGDVTVPVGTAFQDGETVRDAYTGETYVVSGGNVNVTAGANGVVLLETTGKVEPYVSVSPNSQEYYTDSIQVTLNCSEDVTAKYSIDGETPKAYTNGTKISVGAGQPIGTSTTVTVTGIDGTGKTLESKSATYIKVIEPEGVTVHVKNTSWSGTPNIYMYSGTGATAVNYTGAWPGAAMTAESDGWYVYQTKETKTATVIFNGTWGQYPTAMQPGLEVAGEVWILNNQVVENPNKTETGKVIVKYVDANGNEIATSKTMTGNVGDAYSTTAVTVSGYKLSTTPSNASGKYTKADITVTYVYTKDVVIPDPSDPLAISTYKTSLATPQKLGATITLTTNTTGGEGTVKYRFVAIRNGKTTFSQAYSTNNTATWKPTLAGTYTLYFKAIDDNKKEVSKTMTYVVTGDPLTLTTYKTSVASPQKVGTSITLTSAATGGSGTINYRFVAMKDGKTKTFAQGYSTKSTATWKPTQAGTYKLHFKIKDGTGKEIEKIVTYVVTEAEAVVINSLTTSSISPQQAGTAITITANAASETTVSYKFWIYKMGEQWNLLKDFSTANKATWTPSESGSYVIWVDAKDTKGNITSKCINFKVTDKVTLIQEDNAKISYSGIWSTAGGSNYNGGTKRFTKSNGAYATFKFNGTGMSILATTSKDRGVAEVYIDGNLYPADMYSATTKYKAEVFNINGLTAGSHTVTIKYSGLHAGQSAGTTIEIDAFKIFNGNII